MYQCQVMERNSCGYCGLACNPRPRIVNKPKVCLHYVEGCVALIEFKKNIRVYQLPNSPIGIAIPDICH